MSIIRTKQEKIKFENKNNELLNILENKKSHYFDIQEKDIVKLIYKSDLNHININNENALHVLLKSEKTNEIKLSSKDIDYLIKNSNLNQKDIYGMNPLMNLILYQNNLTQAQFEYLLFNTNLKTKNNQNESLWTLLIDVLYDDSSINTLLNYDTPNSHFTFHENLFNHLLKNTIITYQDIHNIFNTTYLTNDSYYIELKNYNIKIPLNEENIKIINSNIENTNYPSLYKIINIVSKNQKINLINQENLNLLLLSTQKSIQLKELNYLKSLKYNLIQDSLNILEKYAIPNSPVLSQILHKTKKFF